MATGDRQTRVDGIVYDNLRTIARNACIQPGRVLGFLGATHLVDLATAGVAPSTIAAQIGVLEENMVIAAAATSDSAATGLLPANTLILGVVARVTVAIPTATTFNIGDALLPTRLASNVAVGLGTTAVCTNHWAPAPYAISTGGVITGVSAASPAVLTMTSNPTGVLVGQTVQVAGVVGAVGINGQWRVTAVTSTTITVNNPISPGTFSASAASSVSVLAGPRQTANAAIRITPSATPGTAVGRVRLQVLYMLFTPPPA